MQAAKTRLDAYSVDDFVRVADRIASWKGRPADADPKDRQIELWIRYFTSKYSLKASDLLDFDRAYDLIEERSEAFENGLSDLGFLTKFRKRVLTKVATPDAANLLRIFEKSPLTYFAWDCPNDRTVSNVSANVEKNFGYVPDEFVRNGKAFVELIYPDDFMRVQREIYENVEVKKLPEYDLYYRVLHSDGRIRFIHDHTHVVYDESGNAVQSFGFVIDVTDREETRMMLDDYVRAIDQSAIVQIVDKDGIIRYANDLYRNVSGDERDVVWRPVRMLWGRKYHDEGFWKELWTTVLAGKVWSGVVQNPVPKAGSDESYYTHTTITPLLNAKGEYDRFIAIKFDITRLKEVESALRRTNARFEKILDSTSQGFWSIDAALNIREVNASFCSLLGYDESEIVGRNVRDFMDAENVAVLEKKSSTMMTTDHRSYDVSFRTKDGTSVPVSILATTIRDENGKFQEAIAFISDATETKAFQKKLYVATITDELTGVGNRRHFNDSLERAFSELQAGNVQTLSLAVCDIDHFKTINDKHGHPGGDQVLRHLGRRLRELSGRGITAYRYGGEEFVLMGEGVPLGRMRDILEKLRAEFQDEPISAGNGGLVNATLSAGVASFDRESATGKICNDLLLSTDALLYLAKNSGRNNVKCQGDM